MLAEYFDDYAARYAPYKGGAWCYEDGLIYRGLELLHAQTGDPRWLAHLTRLVEAQLCSNGGLLGYQLPDYNIDNTLPGRALMYLASQTNDARYGAAADVLAGQFDTHPRTKSGVFWHKLRYPWQIWLDGLYMGHPFRISHAQARGDGAAVRDSLAQISTSLDILLDPQTGLYKHAFDEARQQPWADPQSGHSGAFWGRAIGWLAMALVDVADLVGDAFEPLRPRTCALLEAVDGLQVPDGLWLQVLDRPDLAGNYQESSASAMFAYAFERAARLGLAAPKEGLTERLFAQSLAPKAGGGFEMVQMCEVAGLGWYEGRFRDGSAAYYVSEPLAKDDPKGVGPLMMTAALAGALAPQQPSCASQ